MPASIKGFWLLFNVPSISNIIRRMYCIFIYWWYTCCQNTTN